MLSDCFSGLNCFSFVQQVNDFVRDKFTDKDNNIPFFAEIMAGGCVSSVSAVTLKSRLTCGVRNAEVGSFCCCPGWRLSGDLHQPTGDREDSPAGGRRDHHRAESQRSQCGPRPRLLRPLQGGLH